MKYTDKKVTIHQIVDTFYKNYNRSLINEYSSFMNDLLELSLINEVKEESLSTWRTNELEEEYGSASVYVTINKK